jgi:SLT domain-containing protein
MYNNYGYNPYYPQQQRFQNVDQSSQQPMMATYQPPIQLTKPTTLLGKAVESIDVVKATDIPLDGSISYFPLTDGSAIVSKQLQTDGTSKIVVYKPTQEDKKEEIKYVTIDDLQEAINDIDLSDIQDLKDDVKEIKKQLKEFKIKKGKED